MRLGSSGGGVVRERHRLGGIPGRLVPPVLLIPVRTLKVRHAVIALPYCQTSQLQELRHSARHATLRVVGAFRSAYQVRRHDVHLTSAVLDDGSVAARPGLRFAGHGGTGHGTALSMTPRDDR